MLATAIWSPIQKLASLVNTQVGQRVQDEVVPVEQLEDNSVPELQLGRREAGDQDLRERLRPEILQVPT